MTQKLKSWNKKRKELEHEQELITRRQTVIFNLMNDLTTEESLLMYKDISSLFKNKIESRFNSISEEKVLIESFLNN